MWGVVVAHKMVSVSLRPLFWVFVFCFGTKGFGAEGLGQGLDNIEVLSILNHFQTDESC